MIVRLKLTLEQAEYSALIQSALADLRDPSDQARFILRQELERRGLLVQHQVFIFSGFAGSKLLKAKS